MWWLNGEYAKLNFPTLLEMAHLTVAQIVGDNEKWVNLIWNSQTRVVDQWTNEPFYEPMH